MQNLTRLLLVVPAAVLFALGWSAGRIANVASWCWSALGVGWDSARRVEEPVTAPLRRVA